MVKSAEMRTFPAPQEGEERGAPDLLFEMLYVELRRLARRQLMRCGSGVTLGVSTLLHEAYLNMAKRDAAFPDRGRFLAYAAKVMRGLIVDYARSRRARKRGGSYEITALLGDVGVRVTDDRHLMGIADAIDDLATVDPSLAEIVNLRFFCGLSFGEIAAIRGLSERTVHRHWEKARAYLHAAIDPAGAR